MCSQNKELKIQKEKKVMYESNNNDTISKLILSTDNEPCNNHLGLSSIKDIKNNKFPKSVLNKQFIPPMPMDWFIKACQCKCAGAVEAACCCYYSFIVCGKKPFHITRSRATTFGLKDSNKKNKALKCLAQMGLISISQRIGKSHEINIIQITK